jgi:cytochrome c-type biogenesis protein CcmH/NrfG
MSKNQENAIELQQKVTKIFNKEDLAQFVEDLRTDLRLHPDRWENQTLDRFLEAMASWIQSMDGYYANAGRMPPTAPDWSTFADILYASRVYE